MTTPELGNSGRASHAVLLREIELAARWDKSIRTLQRMRQHHNGPPWFVVGRTVFYRLSDILAFEAASLRGEAP